APALSNKVLPVPSVFSNNTLRVASYFFGATIKWNCSNAYTMGLKTIYTSLFILRIEQPFPIINVCLNRFFLPLKHAFLIVTGICSG
ncbi:MAG: hypothetical protein RPR97_10190, partial [Colwellia sp.]